MFKRYWEFYGETHKKSEELWEKAKKTPYPIKKAT